MGRGEGEEEGATDVRLRGDDVALHSSRRGTGESKKTKRKEKHRRRTRHRVGPTISYTFL